MATETPQERLHRANAGRRFKVTRRKTILCEHKESGQRYLIAEQDFDESTWTRVDDGAAKAKASPGSLDEPPPAPPAPTYDELAQKSVETLRALPQAKALKGNPKTKDELIRELLAAW